MRILVDAYWWATGPVSGRSVVRGIVQTWVQHYPEDTLVVLVRPGVGEVASAELGAQVEVREFSRLARMHALAVLSMRAPIEEFDFVLTQNFGAPFCAAPVAALVYDVTFETNPEWFTRRERLYLRRMRRSVQDAAVVLTISNSEAARIRRVWPEVSARLAVAPLAVPIALEQADAQRPALPGGSAPFVLAVGRLNVRKNLVRLVEAFGQFSDEHPDYYLYVVGEADGKMASTRTRGAARIHYLGHVSDSHLKWLYENCGFFVLPSLGEGFGLPLLEAAKHGAVIAASDLPEFRELSVADVHFDPRDVDSIAAAMRKAATTRRGGSMPSFSWQRTVVAARSAMAAATLGTGAQRGN